MRLTEENLEQSVPALFKPESSEPTGKFHE